MNENSEQKTIKVTLFSNSIVGIISLFFGPIAGGLLVHLNLKKIGNNNGVWIVLLAFLLSIYTGYRGLYNGNGLLNTICVFSIFWPVIFVILQKIFVVNRNEDNGNILFDSNGKAIGLGIIGLIVYSIIILLSIIIVQILFGTPIL